MIRKWLLKHRWINEALKLICAAFSARIGYWVWFNLGEAPTEVHFALGIFTGIIICITLTLLTDIAFSIPKVIKALKGDVEE